MTDAARGWVALATEQHKDRRANLLIPFFRFQQASINPPGVSHSVPFPPIFIPCAGVGDYRRAG